jgi:hypothetical protein
MKQRRKLLVAAQEMLGYGSKDIDGRQSGPLPIQDFQNMATVTNKL